ncbi:MAG: DNA alkylation repair protein [Candidatus Pacebacteria bacterium]|nr:DNA alkylation repair protein [Candidatus Paceibacterota bacterium]
MQEKKHLLNDLKKELRENADEKQAVNLRRFFKTARGEYGEGDVFLGIKVPIQREICKKYIDFSLGYLQKLLDSKIHEERFCALAILGDKYRKADEVKKKDIFEFYLKNAKRINNWDLVDLSAPNIVGDYLLDKDREILYDLARSDNLWQRRIAVLSTFTFVRERDFGDTLRIAEMLLRDEHDLIHKAVGWMLREIGKRDLEVEEKFLRKHYKKMTRTMLRYAIEKFDEEKRRYYMTG